MKGSDLIVDILIKCGVKDIFGYPGGYVLDIYESLRKRQSEITHYLTNDEQGASFCANGYGRIGKELGVVLATSGPGATNTLTGVADAFMDSVPMLIITGNVQTNKLGTDSFQEVDIVGMTMPITKYNVIVKHKEDLAKDLANAIQLAKAYRKGPVLIDIPQDIQCAEIDINSDQIGKLLATVPKRLQYEIEDNQLYRAVKLIKESKNICIICGGGINSEKANYASVDRFVKALNVPVITTLMGVNTFSNKDKRYFGLIGNYGNLTANHILKTCDLMITLGVRFGDRMLNRMVMSAKNIIQIDVDKAEDSKNIESVCFLNGSINETISILMPLIESKSDDYIDKCIRYRNKFGVGDNQRKIHNLLDLLSEYVGEDAIVATDVGNHQVSVAKNYKFGKSFLTSGGLGAMGFGLPALIGGLIANKNSKGLLITGDGSFNMNCTELHLATRLKLPILIVIFNNRSLEMCADQQLEKFGAEYMTANETGIDYVLLAKSYGARGVRVNNINALKKVLENYEFDKPMVVDFDLTR